MEIETLGVTKSLGWKVHMRCANGLSRWHEVHSAVPLSQLDLDDGCHARAELPAVTARVAPHVPSLWESKGDGGL
jgi:hypothetical protein